jgi:uracil-DNA glycosylase
MGVTAEEFYDRQRVAIVPMSFCFPGQDDKGADLPPRPECAATWHRRLFAAMPQLELILLVGHHAQRWHLGGAAQGGLSATMARWRELLDGPGRPRYLPLPHPSWRNNAWLKANPWFERDVLPRLRLETRRLLGAVTACA